MAAEGQEAALGLQLELAIKRVWLAVHILSQNRSGWLRSVGGAAGEENAAAHADIAGSLKKPHRAVEIGAAELLRIVAFTAPVVSGR